MKRLSSALAVIALCLAVAVVGAPAATASVVDAPPPPVSEYPYKPSSLVATTEGSDAVKSAQNRWTLVEDARKRATKPATAPRQLAPAKVPVRGGGGPLALALWAPMLVDGGLRIFTYSAEARALGIEDMEDLICGGIGPTVGTGFAEWLYGSYDCGIVVVGPNEDVTAGASVSFGGKTLSYLGTYYAPPPVGVTYFCYGASSGGTFPSAGYSIRRQMVGGAWSEAGALGSSGPGTQCGGTATYSAARQILSGPVYTEVFEVFEIATGNVVGPWVSASADPVRQMRCRVGWSDSTETLGLGAVYQESAGLPISGGDTAGCEEAYAQRPGTETIPEWVKIESDDGGSITEIADFEVPAEADGPKQGRGLRLEKVVGTTVQSCMTWEADCANWWTESEQGTVTDTYRCTYAGEEIDLAECGVYRHTFQDPQRVVVSDPVTGADQNWAVGETPAGSTDPSAGPTPGEECMASWPSAPDPISWVFWPVRCALVWAFVPRQTVVTAQTTAMSTAWDDTMPGKLPAIVGTLFAPPAGVDGCLGPHVYFELPMVDDVAVDWYPLNACEPPGSTVAGLARTIGAAILLFLTALGVIRRISAIVNAPGVGGGGAT